VAVIASLRHDAGRYGGAGSQRDGQGGVVQLHYGRRPRVNRMAFSGVYAWAGTAAPQRGLHPWQVP